MSENSQSSASKASRMHNRNGGIAPARDLPDTDHLFSFLSECPSSPESSERLTDPKIGKISEPVASLAGPTTVTKLTSKPLEDLLAILAACEDSSSSEGT